MFVAPNVLTRRLYSSRWLQPYSRYMVTFRYEPGARGCDTPFSVHFTEISSLARV